MNTEDNIKISVIIPFYQEDKGVLSRSLHSVFSQSAKSYISEVIVVDDGSPCPAESEMQRVIDSYDFIIPIKLVKQQNSGVSAARNAALRQVQSDATHIAFLDSDDIWQVDHIQYAVKAIRLGAKFFFSNFYQLNSQMPAFEKASKFDVKSCEKIDNEIYRFNSCFINQIITSNPVGTPTVVYLRSDAEDLLFDQRFKYAGEDYMMWISLVKRLGNVYFCTIPTVHCGAGVNIFSGAKWGSVHLSERLIDEIAYNKLMLQIPELYVESYSLILNRMGKLKKSLFDNTLSRLARLKIRGLFKSMKAYFL